MNETSNFTLEDYVRILNQYQELQQENHQLKAEIKLYEDNKKYLNDRIEKAIEYIENNPLYEEEYDYNYEDELYLSGISDETASKDLKQILKGEESE